MRGVGQKRSEVQTLAANYYAPPNRKAGPGKQNLAATIVLPYLTRFSMKNSIMRSRFTEV